MDPTVVDGTTDLLFFFIITFEPKVE